MESNSISRLYCETLDRFVSIIECSKKDIKSLLEDIKGLEDKRSYYDLIIAYCVAGYVNEISSLINRTESLALIEDIIREELYGLCIKINPSLDIKKVRINVTSSASKIRLLGPFKPVIDELNVEDLEDRLRRRVIGQDDAICVVSDCIRTATVGLREASRPIASLIFVGRTGVGKTELAKALSVCLFGEEKSHFIRVDCSEYSQAHEYAKLIGAPPGYIGHGEGGHLTEAVKLKKNCVVLFDEIEKAHTKVHNLLLQILDDGVLTDSKGVSVDFCQSVVILTSNIGVAALDGLEKSIGFTKEKVDHTRLGLEIKKDLERQFSPEFINRLDEIVVFRDLDSDTKEDISVKMLHELVRRAGNNGHRLKFTQALAKHIASSASDNKYGARPLRRTIQRLVSSPLAKKLLNKEFDDSAIILMDIRNGEIIFSEVKKVAKT